MIDLLSSVTRQLSCFHGDVNKPAMNKFTSIEMTDEGGYITLSSVMNWLTAAVVSLLD